MKKDEKRSVADLGDEQERTIKFSTPVIGHTFNREYTLIDFIKNYSQVGFQATNLSLCIDEIRRMLGKAPLFDIAVNPELINLSKNNIKEPINELKRSKIFFGCTSNMVSSGLRDTICYLAKNKYFDVFVTTAGGIEEDLIKCLHNTFLARFDLDGKVLRQNGYNRIGNLVIPNENYCSFEIWLKSMLEKIIKDHCSISKQFGLLSKCCESTKNIDCTCEYIILTPSQFIRILGTYIDDESSILYWCARNNIPVYCPAITDGSIGDILTFYNNRDLIKLDVVRDIHDLNMESLHQESTGAIILGSGVVKHAILNSNLFRDGADYLVLLNNASEFDGSDAGANISEAVSWGKSKGSGIKVFGDATILFPLIVAGAFTEK